jgi:hypothetical protein
MTLGRRSTDGERKSSNTADVTECTSTLTRRKRRRQDDDYKERVTMLVRGDTIIKNNQENQEKKQGNKCLWDGGRQVSKEKMLGMFLNLPSFLFDSHKVTLNVTSLTLPWTRVSFTSR